MANRRLHLILRICAGIAALFLAVNSVILYQERFIPTDSEAKPEGYFDTSGIVHLHTVYSDGGGDFSEIVRAARATGQEFLITADHNTIAPYREGREGIFDGVLVLTAVEISSAYGHIVFYDGADSFRNYDPHEVEKLLLEARELRDTLLFLAHPTHPRMTFTAWELPGFQGMEVFNGDVQWRDDSIIEILSALTGMFIFREAANHLIDYPRREMERWDQMFDRRRIFAIGASDAHSNIRISKSWNLRFPSYETLFEFAKTHVITRDSLNGDFAHDKTLIVRALKAGNSYLELGNLCDPEGFLFYAGNGPDMLFPGESGKLGPESRLIVRIPSVPAPVIRIFRNGSIFAESTNEHRFEQLIKDPGVYRVEVFQMRSVFPGLSSKKIPWIISNPVFISGDETN